MLRIGITGDLKLANPGLLGKWLFASLFFSRYINRWHDCGLSLLGADWRVFEADWCNDTTDVPV